MRKFITRAGLGLALVSCLVGCQTKGLSSRPDSATPQGGAVSTGGLPGAGGGPSSGGTLGQGGSPNGSGGKTGTGGSIGTGGASGSDDASAGVACTDDAGSGFAAVARQCTQDSDCAIYIAQRCCGASGALGIAKAQENAYAGCFALPAGGCGQLGCATYIGYVTDTGKTTPYLGSATQPLDEVSVACVGRLCTTDVVVPPDAGQDATSAGDLAVNTGGQPCGNSTCSTAQTCVLFSGGPAPLCQAVGDGGCPPGLVHTASCFNPSTGTQVSPGCTEPPSAPGCKDIPAGCSDLCTCLCPSATGGGSCTLTSAYLYCAYP